MTRFEYAQQLSPREFAERDVIQMVGATWIHLSYKGQQKLVNQRME